MNDGSYVHICARDSYFTHTEMKSAKFFLHEQGKKG